MKRLEANPARVWLSEQNLPKFGTIEQATRQLEADKKLIEAEKKLAETIRQTSTRLIGTEKRIQEVTQKASEEVKAARSELANLHSKTEDWKASEESCRLAATAAQKSMTTAQEEFGEFQQFTTNFKTRAAKELNIQDMTALEFQITINGHLTMENFNLTSRNTKMREQIDSIPRQLAEAASTAVSDSRSRREKTKLFKWSIPPLVLVVIVGLLTITIYHLLSRNLEAELTQEKRTSEELRYRNDQSMLEIGTQRQQMENTISILRQISPEVDRFY